MIIAGFKSTFRPFHEKQAALRKVVAELKRYDESGKPRESLPPSHDDYRPRASAVLDHSDPVAVP
jgi:hypothetical protein